MTPSSLSLLSTAVSIPGFLLRVWVRFKEEGVEENGESLVFEKNVELFDLSYLGLMVRGGGKVVVYSIARVSLCAQTYTHGLSKDTSQKKHLFFL